MNALLDLAELAQRTAFDLEGRPRLVFGCGTSARAGELARSVGGTRALLVTDAGIVRAGHAARVEASLRAAGLEVAVFPRVHENSTTRDMAKSMPLRKVTSAPPALAKVQLVG